MMEKVLRKIMLLCCMICWLQCLAARDEVLTQLHSGHVVHDVKVSYDNRYLFAVGNKTVVVWDLYSRLIAQVLNIDTDELWPHPLDSRLFYAENSPANHRVIDWTDGTNIGIVPAACVPRAQGSAPGEIEFSNRQIFFYGPSHRTIGTLGNFTPNIGSARSNHNDSLLVTSGITPVIWDLRHVKPAGLYPYHKHFPDSLNLLLKTAMPWPEGYIPVRLFTDSYFMDRTDKIIACGIRDTTYIYDKTTNTDHGIPVGAGPTHSLLMSGDTIVAVTSNGVRRSIAEAPFEELEEFRLMSANPEFNTISRLTRDGRFYVGSTCKLTDNDPKPTFIEGDFRSGMPTRAADYSPMWVTQIKLAPDDSYAAVISSTKGTLCVAELSGEAITFSDTYKPETGRGIDVYLNACEVLPGDIIVAGNRKGEVKFWKKDELIPFNKVLAHTGPINSIALSNDSTRFFTSAESGDIMVWDAVTLTPLVQLNAVFGQEGTAYAAVTPDGYYKSSTNAFDFINFSRNGVAYSFDQFDLRQNRPDIVLERMGGDPDEVELLRKAYLKRLRRAGFSPEQLSHDYHVPVVEIPDIQSEPAEDGTIRIDASFSDSRENLAEISVTLNGVEVLPPAKRKVNGRFATLNEKIALASGDNRIEINCLNSQGARSAGRSIFVTYEPKKPRKPDLYVVAAGVSKHDDAGFDLNYAAKDASDFAETIGKLDGNQFGSVKQFLLIDSDFGADALPEIADFLSRARRDDVVILFYAGHGVLDSDLDYYLATSKINFSNPADGGLPYDDLMSVLDTTPSVNRYCFIDACHSGELDKEDYLAATTTAMPADEELVFRAAGNAVKAREDVERVNTMLDDMFIDLRGNHGATVLSSAGGAELAVESPRWRNGLFTYCLKAVLESRPQLSFAEWMQESALRVSAISEGRQRPELRAQNRFIKLQVK